MAEIVIPGLIDPHVHLREPGGTHKEDFESGTKAAIAGGVTMVLDMPNNVPPITTHERFVGKIHAATKRVYTDIGFHFLGTTESIPQIGLVAPDAWGLKIFLNESTGSHQEEDPETLKRLFESWTSPRPIIVHAEGPKLEEALKLAQQTQRRLHVAHVSLAEEVEMIKNARNSGMNVTAEVTPHHLFLTEQQRVETGLGSFGVMKPALATDNDRLALWKGLKDGVIDLIATDHAPHTKEEKAAESPPSGVPGLESILLLLINTVRRYPEQLSWDDVVRMTSTRAQEIFDLPRQHHTTVQIDTNRITRLGEQLYTKCDWTPFNGHRIQGGIQSVTLRGQKIFEDGQFLTPPQGRVIFPYQ